MIILFPGQQEIPDLDEIERELKELDEKILQMAQSNNINPEAVLASTETEPVLAGKIKVLPNTLIRMKLSPWRREPP